MTRSKLVLLSLVVATAASWTSSAFAQTRYYPTRGPISPWMNMWQRKPGPLDNYHTYVQPDIQLQRVISQQQNSLTQNAAGLQSLDTQMQNGQRDLRVVPTGTGSTFMELSHYYPTRGGSAVRARSMPRTPGPGASGKYAR
jgi:hypothetical protein